MDFAETVDKLFEYKNTAIVYIKSFFIHKYQYGLFVVIGILLND